MYTPNDAKKLIIMRKDLVTDLNICEAIYQGYDVSIDPEITKHIQMLQCQISIIDSLFNIVNHTELFVIRSRLIDGMDWPQISTRYKQFWGIEEGLSTRTLQIRLNRGLSKMARAMNQRSKVPWNSVLNTHSCWSATEADKTDSLE